MHTVRMACVRSTILWQAALASTAAIVADVRADDAVRQDGYEFGAVYTAEIWRNASGGLRTGSVYLDNLDMTLGIDGEKAWGVEGLTVFADVLYNNAARLSDTYVGDEMTVSNIDAPEGLRLYELWIDWTPGGQGPFSVRFGLYDLNAEFDNSESRSLFIHSSHGVGHELGQTGENGPSIFPVTSLGLRLAWEWKVGEFLPQYWTAYLETTTTPTSSAFT